MVRRIGRRIGLGLLIILAVVVGAGGIWQAVVTARERRDFPPPGRLIDVAGTPLHLHCLGTGSPTVVLEAASAGIATDWSWVQPTIAATTRVCAYDRAGRGWSGAGAGARDATRLAAELKGLLDAAGERGPYVLAGHSAGGLFARQFAAQYPEAVAGLALIDAAHPAQATFDPGFPAQLADDRRLTAIFGTLAHVGGMRLLALGAPPAPDLPAPQRAAYRAHYVSPRLWWSVNAELAAREATDAQVAAGDRLGARPVIVVTAGSGSTPAWLAMQADLLTLSTNTRQRTIEGATHLGLLNDEATARQTSAAIIAVVAAVREGRPLE